MEDGKAFALNNRTIVSRPSKHPLPSKFSPDLLTSEFAVARALRCRPEQVEGAVGIYCRDLTMGNEGNSEDSGFLWFPNENELVRFLSCHLLAFFGIAANRRETVSKPLIERYRRREIDRSACVEELNRMLQGTAEVLWWGEFAELEHGHAAIGSFVSRVRCSFYSTDGAPIHLKARYRFRRFIRHYRHEAL